MNRNELIAQVAQATGLTRKDATAAVASVFETVSAALTNGEKVSLPGFGTFEVREHAARTARNPRTGETIEVAASKAPAFKPGKTLKDAVNK